GLADQREGLQGSLDVGRGDVLAPGRDDELLLAIDDLEEAGLVELADVARVQPPLVVDGLGRTQRVLEVATKDVAAPADDLAVLEQTHVTAGDRWPDRARADVERLPGHGSAALRE